MPQSMQRAPCFWSFSVGQGSMTCRQSPSRSSTGRYGCLSRLNSMNPVTLPMCCALNYRRWALIIALAVRAGHDGVVHRDARLLRLLDRGEHALVVLGDHLDELVLRPLPVHEEPGG